MLHHIPLVYIVCECQFYSLLSIGILSPHNCLISCVDVLIMLFISSWRWDKLFEL